MRWRTVLALTIGLVAVSATPATAAHHLMIVSEVALSEGGDTGKQFVELVDPVDETFPTPPYGLSVFDGAGVAQGNQSAEPEGVFASRDNTQPYLFATNSASSAGIRHQELTIPLPPNAGQVCFWKNHNTSDRINCLRYGTITGPVSAGTINQGPTPGTGQSLQVCSQGTVVAKPTPKAANCTGSGGGPGGGGGPAADTRKPKATLSGRKTQDVDKLAVSVMLDENGTVSASGTVRVPNSSKTYRFKKARKSASAGRKVKLRLKLSRKAKRAVKRALGRGRKLKAKLVVTGADQATNRTVKRKTVRLKN